MSKEKSYAAEIQMVTPGQVIIKIRGGTWTVSRDRFDPIYTERFNNCEDVKLKVYAEDVGGVIDYTYDDSWNHRQHLNVVSVD